MILVSSVTSPCPLYPTSSHKFHLFDDALSFFEEGEMLVFPKSEIRGLHANKWFEAMLCRVNSSCGDSKKESHPALDF